MLNFKPTRVPQKVGSQSDSDYKPYFSLFLSDNNKVLRVLLVVIVINDA